MSTCDVLSISRMTYVVVTSSHEGGPIETPGDIRAGKAVKGAGEGVVDLVDHNWDTRQRVGWRDCMQGRSGKG